MSPYPESRDLLGRLGILEDKLPKTFDEKQHTWTYHGAADTQQRQWLVLSRNRVSDVTGQGYQDQKERLQNNHINRIIIHLEN